MSFILLTQRSGVVGNLLAPEWFTNFPDFSPQFLQHQHAKNLADLSYSFFLLSYSWHIELLSLI